CNPQSRSRSRSFCCSSLPCLVNCGFETIEVVFLEPAFIHAEHCGNRARCRVVEERFDEMSHSALAHLYRICRRPIDITRTVMLMLEMAFLFEKPQHSSDSRVTRRIRQLGLNFGRCRAAESVDDCHYLAFAGSQIFHSQAS